MVRLIIEPRLQAYLRKSCQLRLSGAGDAPLAGNCEKTRLNADMGTIGASCLCLPGIFFPLRGSRD